VGSAKTIPKWSQDTLIIIFFNQIVTQASSSHSSRLPLHIRCIRTDIEEVFTHVAVACSVANGSHFSFLITSTTDIIWFQGVSVEPIINDRSMTSYCPRGPLHCSLQTLPSPCAPPTSSPRRRRTLLPRKWRLCCGINHWTSQYTRPRVSAGSRLGAPRSPPPRCVGGALTLRTRSIGSES